MSKSPRKCFECGGRGSFIGNYGIKKRCIKCDGAGVNVKSYCESCEGIGVKREQMETGVTLPPGLTDGKKIRINNMGHASDVYGSKAGDLLLDIQVKEHDEFKLDGLNILSDV